MISNKNRIYWFEFMRSKKLKYCILTVMENEKISKVKRIDSENIRSVMNVLFELKEKNKVEVK